MNSKLKTKKFLLTSGLVVCACAMVGYGAFAFYSDQVLQSKTSTAGLVDITATNLNLTNPDNINPGDNALDLSQGHRRGTEHNLTFNVENIGNKSVVTRNVVDLYVPFGADTKTNASTSATVDITKYFMLDKNNKELKDKYYIAKRTANSDAVVITPDELDNYTFNQIVGVRYVVTEDSLDGVGHAAEIEPENNGKFKTSYLYKLGLEKLTEETDVKPLTTINIDVTVEAMQFRNSADSDWQVVFKETLETKTSDKL